VSADFIYMAATLILIKSKMLLRLIRLRLRRSRAIHALIWCTDLLNTRNSRTQRICCTRSSNFSERVVEAGYELYDTEGTEAELVVSLVDFGESVSASAGARQSSCEDRIESPAIYRGADD